MKRVRTAKGKMIDMGALAKANEEVRAVSNVPINARGDRLDASGNVVATVQSVARKQHEHAQPPQKRKLSDATQEIEAKPVPRQEKAEAAPAESVSSAKVKRRHTKVRDDGTKYVEVEYTDGSFEVEEVEK